MSRPRRIVATAVVALLSAVPAVAQPPARPKGDPREVVRLEPAEVATLLAGMRTYLESIQGIVAAMAENKVARVPNIAARAGAKMLQGLSPATGLKLPLAFTAMSFDTHGKFDKLADNARGGASRSEILVELRDIMANCNSCHATYRLAP